MLCDGSEILEGPMASQRTPNLNGEERFLRGTAIETNAWQFQDAMLENHIHDVNDPGHTHTDEGRRM